MSPAWLYCLGKQTGRNLEQTQAVHALVHFCVIHIPDAVSLLRNATVVEIKNEPDGQQVRIYLAMQRDQQPFLVQLFIL